MDIFYCSFLKKCNFFCFWVLLVMRAKFAVSATQSIHFFSQNDTNYSHGKNGGIRLRQTYPLSVDLVLNLLFWLWWLDLYAHFSPILTIWAHFVLSLTKCWIPLGFWWNLMETVFWPGAIAGSKPARKKTKTNGFRALLRCYQPLSNLKFNQ